MKITFLGTGTSQGIPVIASDHPVSLSKNPKDKRLRTSAMVSWGNTNINIDCGPDFRFQMLQHQVTHLEAILFTHEHSDHTAGIDDIRPFVHLQGDMPIYAQKRVLESLEKRFDYIFDIENHYPGAPSVETHQVDDKPFMLYGQKVTPLHILHGKLPILGYRIGDLAYITDAKFIEDEELEKIKGVNLLVLNTLRKEREHHSHLILPQALEIIDKVQPKKTYLTHISQDFGFHDEISKGLPDNVKIAYDGLEVEI